MLGEPWRAIRISQKALAKFQSKQTIMTLDKKHHHHCRYLKNALSTKVILTSLCNTAALRGSLNQCPSEFGEGRVLLMNKFPRKMNRTQELKKIDTIIKKNQELGTKVLLKKESACLYPGPIDVPIQVSSGLSPEGLIQL